MSLSPQASADPVEEERLAALQSYDLLDTPPEQDIDDLVRLAAQICQTPVALVTLVDGRRQVFKARYGFDGLTSDLATGFCPLVVRSGSALTIPDTLSDGRYAENGATRRNGVRFYSGVPLRTRAGHILGTLCVIDTEPRDLDDAQQGALVVLARQVMAQFDLRATLRRERESDRRHRLTLDSVVDYAIVGVTADGRVRDCNTGAARILGVPVSEATGLEIEALIGTEAQSDWFSREARSAEAEGRSAGERSFRLRNGTTLWARWTLNPLRDGSGALVGFVLVLLDRMAERRKEQSLALLARAAAGLITAAKPDSYLEALLAESGPVIGFDHAYSHVIAADGQHLQLGASLGLTEAERAAYSHTPFDATVCASVLEARHDVVINDIQSNPDPRCRPIRLIGLQAYAAFPVMVGDTIHGVLSFGSTERTSFDAEALTFFATLARYVSMMQDRMRGERSLRDLAANLEQRVADRTTALQEAEAALRQSQKMEAVGQLTGGVAHDFNNLLTIIRSSTDLLRRPGLAEERRKRYLDAVSDTVDRAAKLTGQLLAFARRQALNPEVFDACHRVRSVADLLDSVTGARIRVKVETAAETCYVKADASQFETALVNMAVNARDAMDGQGDLVLTVEGIASLPRIRGHAGSAEHFVAVSLSDTGIGIDPEVIGRIFEPFFTTKEVGKGTGLGLSQVFGFAKQSGGDIDVHSQPGVGTTFTLYLPQVETPGERLVTNNRDGFALSGNGRRVLVVEDNLEIGQFVVQILDDLGFRSEWATDAAQALATLARTGASFDVVFSDVVMPGGMDGIDLAHEIERRYPGLPVVLTSGYSHVLARGGPQGFHLLHKPYSVEQLSQALGRVMAPLKAEDARR